MQSLYTEKEIIRIAKRENNNKRKYLVVNSLQAKHIPSAPDKTLAMFDELAKALTDKYKNKKVLAVGFAETATAIGARVAININCMYIQTTREDIKDVEYLYFTESHSHAEEQKLIKTDLDKIISEVDCIIFVEDEVTTGNTIMKIVNIIKNTYKMYSENIEFAVASIVNGMDKEALNTYNKNNIALYYIVKTDNSIYTKIAEEFQNNGKYITNLDKMPAPEIKVKKIDANGYINARRLVSGTEYGKACEKLWMQISEALVFTNKESVLVLGTEEFMYAAIYIAYRLQSTGCTVKSHSTTRSPIITSSDKNYPLHCRYELRSVYDDNRKTFIYDIGCYDKVIIITDSYNNSDAGINDLCKAVYINKNLDISVVRWCVQ